MKRKPISLRLSETELKKLENDSRKAGMTQSCYIRELIAEQTPKEDNCRQELASHFCNLYRVINENHLETNDALMEEVGKLCQILY